MDPKFGYFLEMIQKQRWKRVVTTFFVGMGIGGALLNGSISWAEEDPAEELVRARAELQKAYQTINSMNPMSEHYGKTPVLPGGPGEQKFGSEVDQLQKMLSAPAVKGYLRLFSNPDFSRGMNQVVEHPHRKILLYFEIGLIVFMLIFRAWRFSKTRHWFARLWVNVYTWGMYLGLSVIVLPAVILGKPYVDTLQGLIQLALQSLKN